MSEERFPGAIQESIVTAVALIDDDNSIQISNLIEPALFDQPFDDIVSVVLDHRSKHKKPPGRAHIDDVFAYVLENKDHKQYTIYNKIIVNMVRQAGELDTRFILSKTQEFIWIKRNRATIEKLVDTYQKKDGSVLDSIESLYRQGLKIRNLNGNNGFDLASSEAFDFLYRNDNDHCLIGIPELDKHGVHPTKKELLAFVGARNRGKSMFLHHCGKFASVKGWAVAHYTLENSKEMTAQRYYQTFFAGVKRSGEYHQVKFIEDNKHNVSLRTEKYEPEFIIENKDETVTFLTKKVKEFHNKLEQLHIREFPSGKLTFEGLERDLDDLEAKHKFRPDIVMVDSPQLMKLNRNKENHLALDELITDLRGLAIERNIAVVVTHQGNRAADKAATVQGIHVAGTIGIMNISDNVITYSQTDSEEKHGTARLYTQKVRNDSARLKICITQHYPSCQFCMDSRFMTDTLSAEVKKYTGGDLKDPDADSGSSKNRAGNADS